jgi:hypothetical protein
MLRPAAVSAWRADCLGKQPLLCALNQKKFCFNIILAIVFSSLHVDSDPEEIIVLFAKYN